MDRCALFVDAGYVLADGAMAVHGTRRRESVSWDYPGLLQLLSGLATERSRLPLLRCYWYDSTVEGRRSEDHESLADLPGVKLRVAKMRPGRREGVESEIHRDLTTLARNKAVSDAVVVSAEEDLGQVISDVQDMGVRVTLLHIPVDGDPTVSRALRQECDDVAEISAAHLRPYVELISGAEPPRPDERDGVPLGLRPGVIVNGNGRAAAAGHEAAYPQQVPVNPGTGPQPVPPAAVAAFAAAEPEPDVPVFQEQALQEQAFQEPAFQEQAFQENAFQENAFQERAFPEHVGQDRQPVRPPVPPADSRDDGRVLPDFGRAADYADYPDYGAPGDSAGPGHAFAPDYGDFPGYGPAAVDFAPAPADPPAFRPDQRALRQDHAVPGRQESPARPELPARADLYGVPAGLPLPAEELPAELPAARIRPDSDPSGYSPGAVREQYRPDPQGRQPLADDTDRYQPVPSGTAQVRRLPTRGAPADGPGAGQPAVTPQALGQVSPGQPVTAAPGMVASTALPGGPAEVMTGQQPSAGHPVAPVVPMTPGVMGYSGGRFSGPGEVGTGQQGLPPGGLPGGGQPLSSPVAPVAPVAPVVSAPAVAPVAPGFPAGPAGYRDSGDPAGQFGPIGPAAYGGGQSGVSLADAVQSAHDEGQEFGESVARDAPALWLEAVLARKPRMPSDLEARLLQGSALPIDFLLHDEVRHALRRGFWDAMERARR